MRFSSLVCRVFLFGSFVFTAKYNRFHYGAFLIEDQLNYFEMMLDTFQKFNFGPDIRSLIENKDKLPLEQRTKRISLHEKCIRKARDGILYFVKKNNARLGQYFHFLLPEIDQVQYEPKMAEKGKNEYIQIAIEMKQFFFHEMPNYYIELGKNMSIDFTEEEIKREEKIISDAQEESKQGILQMSKQMGITDAP